MCDEGTVVGTPAYTPPEILHEALNPSGEMMPQDSQRRYQCSYGHWSDVFGMGTVLYTLYAAPWEPAQVWMNSGIPQAFGVMDQFLQQPWYATILRRTALTSPVFEGGADAAALELLLSMLQKDPHARPTAQHLWGNEYFDPVRDAVEEQSARLLEWRQAQGHFMERPGCTRPVSTPK